MSKKPKYEHSSVKSDRLDSLPQSEKDFITSLYEQGSIHRLSNIAKELNVVYPTLLRKIKYWQFLKQK